MLYFAVAVVALLVGADLLDLGDRKHRRHA